MEPVRRRVAVIEDNPFWQYQFRQHLKSIDRDLDVKVLNNAEEFYDLKERPEDFDLIISDHFLGSGQTGASIWRDLRKRNCDVPFALTSGVDRRDLAAISTYSDQPEYIEKPYRFHEFKSQISQLLETPRLAPAQVESTHESEWIGAAEIRLVLAAVLIATFMILFSSADKALHILTTPTFGPAPMHQELIFDGPAAPKEFRVPQQFKTRMARVLTQADDFKRMMRNR